MTHYIIKLFREKKSSNMNKRKQELEIFFDQYAILFNGAIHTNNPDPESTAAFFAGCFVEASPMGINCGKNDKQFRSVIPDGYAFYKSTGITSMDIISKEITILDALHAMVKVHWCSRFTRKDQVKGEIRFAVIYFVQSLENEHKIFAYLSGDEQKALRENGLI